MAASDTVPKWRRVAAGAVFLAGGIVIALILRRGLNDVARTAPAAASTLIGVLLSGLVALGVGVRASALVRTLAIGMALILAAASVGSSIYHERVTLPPEGRVVPALREHVLTVIEGQRLLAMTLVYVLLAVTICVGPKVAAEPISNSPGLNS